MTNSLKELSSTEKKRIEDFIAQELAEKNEIRIDDIIAKFKP